MQKFAYRTQKTEHEEDQTLLSTLGLREKQSITQNIVLKEVSQLQLKSVKNECLCLCLGSVLYSSLEYRFNQLRDMLSDLIKEEYLSLLYSGMNKIQSIEDVLLFFPGLFKIQRTIFYTQVRTEQNSSARNLKNYAHDEDDLFNEEPETEEDLFSEIKKEGLTNIVSKENKYTLGMLIDVFRYSGYNILDIHRTM